MWYHYPYKRNKASGQVMSEQKKIRIGVLINQQLDGRYQTCIRTGLSCCAKQKNVVLEYFVGKSLHSPYNVQDVENTVYMLAKNNTIDGMIIITGSIGAFIANEEIAQFVQNFSDFPIVTLGIPIPDKFNVSVDADRSIRTLIHHLKDVHHYKKFAFLFGADTNHDASVRKQIVLECVKQESLLLPPELCLYGDFTYESGKRVAEKFKNEKELPFDVIVAMNDDMALGFIRQMERYGFKSPRDFAITGFDDVDDAHYCHPKLTTVNQSLYRQGFIALEKMYAILVNEQNVEIPELTASVCLRESCGCNPVSELKNPESQAAAAVPEKDGCVNFVLGNNFEIKYPAVEIEQVRQAVSSLVGQFFFDMNSLRQNSLFIPTLNEWLDTTTMWQHYLDVWMDIVKYLHVYMQSFVLSSKVNIWMEQLFTYAFELIAEKTSDYYVSRINNDNNAIMLLCRYLPLFSHADSVNEIMNASSRLIASLDIPKICVCLNDVPFVSLPVPADIFAERPYRNMRGYEVTDVERGDYGPGTVFDSVSLLPPETRDHLLASDTVYLPLVQNDTYYGYVCIPSLTDNPMYYEIIRSCISHICTAYVLSNKAKFNPDINSIPLQYIETDLRLRILSVNKEAMKTFAVQESDKGFVVFLNSLLESNTDEAREKLYDIIHETQEKGAVDYPGITLLNKEKTERVPVMKSEAVYRQGKECVAIRWYLFPIMPFAAASIIPPDSFFTDRGITKREKEIIMLMREGNAISNIAEKMCISESTVKGHITKVYDKLGVSGRNELIACLDAQIKTSVDSPVNLFSVLKGVLTVKNSTFGTV